MTRGDRIPIEQLQRFFSVFAQFPQYNFIWQFDSPKEYYEAPVLKSLNISSLPKHIHIFSWLPLRTLLTDPRVVLLISHGGIRTCVEAMNSGVPMLGLAIQGDQMYNLRRFVERGVGEFVAVTRMTESNLLEKLSKMLSENQRLVRRISIFLLLLIFVIVLVFTKISFPFQI
jgi:hypothetical protein